MPHNVDLVNKERVCDMLEAYCSDEWNEMLDMHRTISEYDVGVRVFSEGQPANTVQIIETGNAKIVTNVNGVEKIIRLASNGRIIGHRGFGGDNTYSVSAIALTPLKVKNIPRKIFDNILRANPEFCFHFMMFFAEELRRSEEQMENVANLHVKNRIAQVLQANMDTFGFDTKEKNKLSYTLSRKDMAGFASTTYESVIRVLSELNKENIIKTAKKTISILDKSALEELCD